jgi:predicted nucleic acid-binding protein
MIVVADSTSLHYLVLIARIEILQKLYGRIYVPASVILELSDEGAPLVVRKWVSELPVWIESRDITGQDLTMRSLGRGEQDGIALATALRAELMLLDDRTARNAANRRGFKVIGTLGILGDAAKLGLTDLKSAIDELRKTNFRVTDALISEVLTEDRK